MGRDPKTLHIADHRASRGLVINHLHGYLPAVRPDQAPVFHPVVLAEDDYHAVAANIADAAWIDHALFHLFETWHVFIVGMSLADRNVRRVLATIPAVGADATAQSRHFAVLKEVEADELGQRRIRQPTRARLAVSACRLRTQHWADYGIQVIDLADHHLLLPLLLRLRYESFGQKPGDLWVASAAHVTKNIRPWDMSQQRLLARWLGRVKELLVQAFQLADDEIADVGLFLLKGAPIELELVTRVGASPAARRGERIFRVDPDAPTGAAGCAFVSGSSMVVSREDAYHDYGGVPPEAGGSAAYAAIFQAPVVDWLAGGIPVGVLYVTVGSSTAALLRRPATEVLDLLTESGQRVLRGLLTRKFP